MQFLTPEDWAEFREQFPDAYVFIQHKSLVGELNSLRIEKAQYPILMNDWKEKRLAELEQWAENTLKIGGKL